MDNCHRKKIGHRDIKPENIVFEADSVESTVKIIDFGRSKLLKPKQKMTECAGSVLLFFIIVALYGTRSHTRERV